MRLKQALVFLFDAVLVSFALYVSFSVRFGSMSLGAHSAQLVSTLPVVIVVNLGLFSVYGMYSGMWRFVGMRDLLVIVKAVTAGSIVVAVALFLLGGLANFPRSIFVSSWFIEIVLVGGSRFAYRLYRESFTASAKREGQTINVLVVGAGAAGDTIIRELLGNYHLAYRPVGLVDDDRSKKNRTIHGVKVLGNTRDIPELVKQHSVEQIFIALPSATAKKKRRILMTCRRTGLRIRTLPGVGELMDGTVTVNALRDFEIEDLLGRDPVRLDTAAIAAYLRNKTVMITGAGGSIGSELCRQVAKFSPKVLVLFERGEFNLYQIHQNLLELFPNLDVRAVIGDVVNPHSVERTLERYMPDVIFHAAAYKHVPLMEMNPAEALRNNTLGTLLVADMARRFGVDKFVMVSTDKAVRSTNVMGVSKRLSELVCEGLNKISSTRYVTVRFGNVLNSVGSVIPLFKRQIAQGGPLTVTHPEIYRYFMTIPESVQLIMQAGAMGNGGEIFILDMGEPVKIVDLARDMIRLSGLVPGQDVKIAFTGLRPGEKLYEELLTDGEEVKATLHEKISVAGRDEVDGDELLTKLGHLFDQMREKGYTQEIIALIKSIVPEYQPENGGPARNASEKLRAMNADEMNP
jgi:FlaA1/EpsC-like NDP-sugar epimerase